MSILKDNENLGPRDLREKLRKSFVVAVGVYNGISGLIAERAGFNALYLSGSGVAGAMGLPDLSVTTLNEVVEEARRIVSVTKSPLIVDADTGFGETINIVRTIRMMESVGVSAVHIEDQILPKKCGHLSGKRVVSVEDMVRKIRMAVEARKDADFLIIARTDSRAVEGLDQSIERAKQYLEVGADMIFTEALESKDEFQKFAKEIHAPLLANMTEFGKSPLLSASELKEIGYKMAIFPLTAFRASLLSMKEVYTRLIDEGTQRNFIDKLMSRNEYYDYIGYDEYEKDDMRIFNYTEVEKDE